MRILIQIKAVFVGLFLCLFVMVPACLIALPFGLERRLKIMSPAWRMFGMGLLRYACHCDVRICEDHRSPYYATIPGKGLYIANHQSYIDIPLVMWVYQIPPIMKKEVLYIPFIGIIAYASGALPVSRSNASSRRKVFELAKNRILTEKIGLQVYPEGTRSKNALPMSIQDVKRTLLVFAYNEKIPVIPTSIYGTRGVLSKFGMIQPNRKMGIIVHKEIDPKDYSDVNAFVTDCWGTVIRGHDEMKASLGPLNENLS